MTILLLRPRVSVLARTKVIFYHRLTILSLCGGCVTVMAVSVYKTRLTKDEI